MSDYIIVSVTDDRIFYTNRRYFVDRDDTIALELLDMFIKRIALSHLNNTLRSGHNYALEHNCPQNDVLEPPMDSNSRAPSEEESNPSTLSTLSTFNNSSLNCNSSLESYDFERECNKYRHSEMSSRYSTELGSEGENLKMNYKLFSPMIFSNNDLHQKSVNLTREMGEFVSHNMNTKNIQKMRVINRKLYLGLGLCSKKRYYPFRPCGHVIHKYGMCKYHYYEWKRKHPFLLHP